MSYTEKQVAFENKEQRIYGFLHMPDGDGPHPAVVMLHGFGGNHIEPHALFPKTARALASEGIGVLRFDFRGSGDSEGEFKDITIQDEVDDALKAISFLETQPEIDKSRLGVIGLSMGGLVASFTAAARKDLRAVVLWSAVANLGQLFLSSGMAGQAETAVAEGILDGGGLALNLAFVQEALTFNPVEAIKSYEGPVLIVHGTADETVPCEHSNLYRSALGDRSDLRLIEGADHTYSSLAWEGAVIDATARFLKTRFNIE